MSERPVAKWRITVEQIDAAGKAEEVLSHEVVNDPEHGSAFQFKMEYDVHEVIDPANVFVRNLEHGPFGHLLIQAQWPIGPGASDGK